MDQILPGQSQIPHRFVIFLIQRRIADRHVIGIQRHHRTAFHQRFQRMIAVRKLIAALDVARQAHFQRNFLINHFLHHRAVLQTMTAMPDPARPQLQRRLYRSRRAAFPGVNRIWNSIFLRQFKTIAIAFHRRDALRAGQIHRYDTLAFKVPSRLNRFQVRFVIQRRFAQRHHAKN